jgi:hypothetical protein
VPLTSAKWGKRTKDMSMMQHFQNLNCLYKNNFMKQKIQLLILLISSILFLENCKKNKAETPIIDNSNSILGNWELRQEQIRTIPATYYLAGNGNTLQFTNSNYSTFTNGNLVKSGQYNLISDQTAPSSVCLSLPENQFKNRIFFDTSSNMEKTFIQVTHDSLEFISGCFALDKGYHYLYVRQ